MITQHGKKIAKISSAEKMKRETPSWKKPGLMLTLKGTNLTKAILLERESY